MLMERIVTINFNPLGPCAKRCNFGTLDLDSVWQLHNISARWQFRRSEHRSQGEVMAWVRFDILKGADLQ